MTDDSTSEKRDLREIESDSAVEFSSTRNIAGELSEDLRQAYEASTGSDESPVTELSSTTLSALVHTLESNPHAAEDLHRRVEDELNQDVTMESIDEVIAALTELGLRVVGPQYHVVLQDVREETETDSPC